jgi:hypothetical protein
LTLQFQEVRVLPTEDGLVPVLEEMAGPVVPAVEGSCVTRGEGAHAPGQWARLRADEHVKVIWEKSPSIHRERMGRGQCGQAVDEVAPVLVIPEDDLPVQPRPITWWSTPGASRRAARGMTNVRIA